jgi:hypothetical protein
MKTNQLAPKHQLVLDGLITKVHNLQNVEDNLKSALIDLLCKTTQQTVTDFDDIFVYEDSGLVATGMGFDEVYINFLNTHGFSNITYSEFNKLPVDVQDNILTNTDIAKAYWQIFTE